jgi:hypothetical protein
MWMAEWVQVAERAGRSSARRKGICPELLLCTCDCRTNCRVLQQSILAHALQPGVTHAAAAARAEGRTRDQPLHRQGVASQHHARALVLQNHAVIFGAEAGGGCQRAPRPPLPQVLLKDGGLELHLLVHGAHHCHLLAFLQLQDLGHWAGEGVDKGRVRAHLVWRAVQAAARQGCWAGVGSAGLR